MKGQKYRLYLRSETWQRKREAALQRAGSRCQLCNSTGNLQVHHRTYERVGRELDSDLTVLCGGCHKRFHRSPARKTPQESAAKRNARAEIDREILAMFEDRDVLSYDTIRSQIVAPRGQIWARVNKMVKGRKLAWCWQGKMLCLYSKRHIV